MKKSLRVFFTVFLLFPALTACKTIDYTLYLSDVRSDLFCAETEEFSLTLSCVSREYPFALDGVASERTNLVEITLTDLGTNGADYEVYVLGDTVWGGDMSFRNVYNDYYYSRGVDRFPERSVTIRVKRNGEAREITATSVKNEATLSLDDALDKALTAEAETMQRLTTGGVFAGEIALRLLRRDKNYFYVGITDTAGQTISLLLDSETGETLARRVSG